VTGSFKFRGALNALLEGAPPATAGRATREHPADVEDGSAGDAARRGPDRPARIAVAASAGTLAAALAAAARLAGRRALLFVPRDAPAAKLARVRESGGELRTVDGDYDAAEAAAAAWAAGREDAELVHAFDDPRVVAGQGTLGLEIMRQQAGIRAVIAPVGGGGLLAGLLAACAPAGVAVLGAQGDRTRAVHDALRTGVAGETTVVPTIMDGLAGRTTQGSVDRLLAAGARVELVPESQVAEAVRLLHGIGESAEGSGAAALAALLAGVYDPPDPVAVVVSGGNIDDDVLAAVLAGTA
jgi:threonine dehydratase